MSLAFYNAPSLDTVEWFSLYVPEISRVLQISRILAFSWVCIGFCQKKQQGKEYCGWAGQNVAICHCLSDPNRSDFESQIASDCNRNSKNHCDSESASNTAISVWKACNFKTVIGNRSRFVIAIAWVTKAIAFVIQRPLQYSQRSASVKVSYWDFFWKLQRLRFPRGPDILKIVLVLNLLSVVNLLRVVIHYWKYSKSLRVVLIDFIWSSESPMCHKLWAFSSQKFLRKKNLLASKKWSQMRFLA